MSNQVLSGKHIAIAHPQSIARDVRLEKTVRILSAAGARITIVCSKEQNKDVGVFAELADLIKVSCGPQLIKSSYNPNRFLRIAYNLFIANPCQAMQNRLRKDDPLRGMAEVLAAHNFDAVHFINYNASLEALRFQKISSVPTVYESYECWPMILSNFAQSEGLFSQKYSRWIGYEQKCVQQAQAFIAVSAPIEEVYSEIAPQTFGVSIYNVAPSPPLKPSKLESKLRFYLQSFLRPHYGIETALRAFSRVEGDYRVSIQGPSYVEGYLEKLKNLCVKLGIQDKVDFLEPCPYKDSVAEANKHDIGFLFFPSTYRGGLKNFNGKWSLPNKLFIYTSAGLGVVFSELQETTRGLLGGSKAALFTKEDSEDSIVETFQILVDNPLIVAKMKDAAVQWAQNYTIESEGQKLSKLYQKVFEQAA